MTEEITNIQDETSAGEGSQKPTGMKRANQVAAIILLLFSAYIIVNSLEMPLYGKYGPGPGLFPLGLGIILAFLSISLFMESSNPKKADKPSPFSNRAGLLTAALVIVGLIFYILMINWIGYVLGTLLFVLFLMLLVQRDKPLTAVITSIIVAGMLYLIFDVGLGVRLPQGPFGF